MAILIKGNRFDRRGHPGVRVDRIQCVSWVVRGNSFDPHRSPGLSPIRSGS